MTDQQIKMETAEDEAQIKDEIIYAEPLKINVVKEEPLLSTYNMGSLPVDALLSNVGVKSEVGIDQDLLLNALLQNVVKESRVEREDTTTNGSNDELNTCRLIYKTKVKYLSCNECTYQSKHKSHLIRHLKRHKGEKPHSCNVCDYQTAYKDHLREHLCMHSGLKPYSCNICEYRTARCSDLKKHSRVHTREKPYICNACGYQTARKSCLKKHVKTHMRKVKSYACTECDFQTVDKLSHKLHLLDHTENKPRLPRAVEVVSFACSICRYRTTSEWYLKDHMLTHDETKLNGCPLCDFRATGNESLKCHLIVHSEKPMTFLKTNLKARWSTIMNKPNLLSTENSETDFE